MTLMKLIRKLQTADYLLSTTGEILLPVYTSLINYVQHSASGDTNKYSVVKIFPAFNVKN